VNTVVWVSSALRADHVGCYGARRVRTPTIDALAAGAVRFDQCIAAAPRTSLAATSIAKAARHCWRLSVAFREGVQISMP